MLKKLLKLVAVVCGILAVLAGAVVIIHKSRSRG